MLLRVRHVPETKTSPLDGDDFLVREAAEGESSGIFFEKVRRQPNGAGRGNLFPPWMKIGLRPVYYRTPPGLSNFSEALRLQSGRLGLY
jgi:hypothetical protein